MKTHKRNFKINFFNFCLSKHRKMVLVPQITFVPLIILRAKIC